MTPFRASLAIAFLALAAPAFGQDLDVSVTALRDVAITHQDGSVTHEFQPVENALPGDEIVYESVVTNLSDILAEDVVIDIPIDPGLILASENASAPEKSPVTSDLSVDRGETYGKLADLTVSEDGETRPATLADVTNLRVSMPDIGANNSVTMSYRAIVR